MGEGFTVLEDDGVVIGGEEGTSQSITKVPIFVGKLYVSSNKGSMWTTSDLETLWDSIGIKYIFKLRDIMRLGRNRKYIYSRKKIWLEKKGTCSKKKKKKKKKKT